MISQEKWMVLTHLQKLPKNVRVLDKLIVSKGFNKLPKVQKIAQSGHTEFVVHYRLRFRILLWVAYYKLIQLKTLQRWTLGYTHI